MTDDIRPHSQRFGVPWQPRRDAVHSPTTVTVTSRVRGPSNSSRSTDCQRPSASSPSSSGIDSLAPTSVARRCESEFCGYTAELVERRSTLFPSNWSWRCPSFVTRSRKKSPVSSRSRDSFSLTLIPAVVHRTKTVQIPVSTPSGIDAATRSVTSTASVRSSVETPKDVVVARVSRTAINKACRAESRVGSASASRRGRRRQASQSSGLVS